ncbi:membrane protein [Kitasatospora griseola]|uniref:Membrane protein n=1 Tax=Kitasatospora griseola TaxID=2064 RepID=A0A0D0PT30_KITGR|nr:zf-HC2 domain-containing protein [Kitasatospora griseola]KIQ65669.1 membrane protein [Kitasatospora griseola]
MSAEHASAGLIGAYLRGGSDLPADTVWALEAHLEGCAPCRSLLAAAMPAAAPDVAALVDSVRVALGPQLDAARPAPVRRPPARWRPAWAAPAVVPWLLTALAVVLLALALDSSGPPDPLGQVSPLLLVAPVLPLCAAAAAWAPGLDPAYELTAATPRSGLPLLLRRTAAALAAVVPVLLTAGALTGEMTAAQWLLPSLAFTTTALALGSVVGVGRAAAALVAVWAAAVAAPVWATGRLPFVLRPEQLPGWALLFALGTATVLARHRAYAAPRT